jgi:hypothetical protein
MKMFNSRIKEQDFGARTLKGLQEKSVHTLELMKRNSINIISITSGKWLSFSLQAIMVRIEINSTFIK